MNALNCKISFFDNCRLTANPVNTGTFAQVVTSGKLLQKFGPLVTLIRATADEKERKRLKEKLPCFTPSGTFGERTAAGLIEPSGLLSFDLDAKENPFLNAGTVDAVKAELCKLPEVAFCQISASGAGLWGVVPMAFPDRHKEQFEALSKAFARMGYKIDPACSDICRLRFWSYDPMPHINPTARTFVGLPKRIPKPPDTYTPTGNRTNVAGNDGEKLEAVVRQIEARSLDITGNYDTWFSLLGSLATLGEAGRDYAHRISRFYIGYDSRETEKQFSYCLRMKQNRFTLGTLFKVADDNGIRYAEHFAQVAAQAAPQMQRRETPAPMPAPRCEPVTEPAAAPQVATLPPGWHRSELQNKFGDKYALVSDADGLPANWSRENLPVLESLKIAAVVPITDATTNPHESKVRLMESYGFNFLGFEPMTPADNAVYERIMKKNPVQG